MTPGKHGNKEAKKPKKAPAGATPPPAGSTPGALAVASLRGKKGPGGHPIK